MLRKRRMTRARLSHDAWLLFSFFFFPFFFFSLLFLKLMETHSGKEPSKQEPGRVFPVWKGAARGVRASEGPGILPGARGEEDWDAKSPRFCTLTAAASGFAAHP